MSVHLQHLQLVKAAGMFDLMIQAQWVSQVHLLLNYPHYQIIIADFIAVPYLLKFAQEFQKKIVFFL